MSDLFRRLLFESVAVPALGLVVYTYANSWLPPDRRGRRSWGVILNGLAFGGISVVLMTAPMQLPAGVIIDTRDIPVALVGLFEGWPAALVAAAVTVPFRLWRGGEGADEGALGLLATATAAGLVHACGKRTAVSVPLQAFTLTGVVFLLTAGRFVLLGKSGLELFSQASLAYLVAYVIGIGFMSRLFHDVIEERRLMAEQQRFRAVLDEAMDAIRIVDADSSRILDVNRADCELSGYSRQEMIGRDAREFWPEGPELSARREAAVPKARDRDVARSYGLPYRTRSGKIVPIDSTRRIVEIGGLRYEIVIFRDATERLTAEAVSREAAELRSATLLARAAAHEINNPLAALLGSLELLAGRLPEDSQEARWVERARQAGERIRDFVARVNRITRIVETPPREGVPPILDTAKSSDPDPRA